MNADKLSAEQLKDIANAVKEAAITDEALKAFRLAGMREQAFRSQMKGSILILSKVEVLDGKKDPSRKYHIMTWRDVNTGREIRLFAANNNKSLVNSDGKSWADCGARAIQLGEASIRNNKISGEPLVAVSCFKPELRAQLEALKESKEEYYALLSELRNNLSTSLSADYLTGRGKAKQPDLDKIIAQNRAELQFDFAVVQQ